MQAHSATPVSNQDILKILISDCDGTLLCPISKAGINPRSDFLSQRWVDEFHQYHAWCILTMRGARTFHGPCFSKSEETTPNWMEITKQRRLDDLTITRVIEAVNRIKKIPFLGISTPDDLCEDSHMLKKPEERFNSRSKFMLLLEKELIANYARGNVKPYRIDRDPKLFSTDYVLRNYGELFDGTSKNLLLDQILDYLSAHPVYKNKHLEIHIKDDDEKICKNFCLYPPHRIPANWKLKIIYHDAHAYTYRELVVIQGTKQTLPESLASTAMISKIGDISLSVSSSERGVQLQQNVAEEKLDGFPSLPSAESISLPTFKIF